MECMLPNKGFQRLSPLERGGTNGSLSELAASRSTHNAQAGLPQAVAAAPWLQSWTGWWQISRGPGCAGMSLPRRTWFQRPG